MSCCVGIAVPAVIVNGLRCSVYQYEDPFKMKFHILHLFGGEAPSVGLPFTTPGERRRWAEHWWEREVSRGTYGDLGFIMDIYPNGTIRFKDIRECYKDGDWATSIKAKL